MDILTRGTALNGHVRVFCCRTTELVQEAATRHHCLPTTAAALGRTLSVGTVMGCMLKSKKEKIEITIEGNGLAGKIVVDAYCGGKVRGYIQNPNVQKEVTPEKLDVGYAVGHEGILRVVKDMGMKTPFVSEVELQSGEIGDDFAYYFHESEQTPSVVSVGVLVNEDYSIKAAGALIIQMMPDATDHDYDVVEGILKGLKPISGVIAEGKQPMDIVKEIFEDYQQLEETPLMFKCECAKGKYAVILSQLPESDLQEMIDEDHGCEVVCKFCNTKYHYGEETLKGYINAKHGARMN